MYVCMQISKSPQHVAERNRKLSNRALVDFIVARGTDDHIQFSLHSPSSMDKKNHRLDTFSKCSIKKVPVPLFIEDREQIDIIYTHLTSILNSTPTHTHSDQIRFIMDVLFPESIICALAVVEHVSILEAEEKFLRGPVIDASEREHFDSRIKKNN
ncbi:PWWP domain-containing DNA repair factor 3A-like [Chanodichthys erythropterus]|uniref:PWWP domain-containing DNA repair factor 3A-like n=1 Tax=Chanodichthys erythropterus TaxID=933992 RepID=UPI00351F16AB